MRNHVRKASLTRLLVMFMAMISVTVLLNVKADAASKPALKKKSIDILVDKQFDLNIANKVKKSSYEWSSGNPKVAVIDNKGIVTGIKKGTTVITCKVTTPTDTYILKCKVTVRKPAETFTIRNKVKALMVGQVYDLNRKLTPSSSNDKTIWTTSDASIAAPDKNGYFTALKEGSVTITGTTLSGKSDSVTFQVVDKNGTVATQKDLEAVLGSELFLITIKTEEAVAFTIPAGDYSRQKLVVDAPKADVANSGNFASIEIKQIKSSTWVEKAIGNLISVLSSNSSIVVDPSATVSIQVTGENVTLKIINNGKVEALKVIKKADIDISGKSEDDIPVVIDIPNVKIKTSVPLNLDCKEKVVLTVLEGAEKTKIHAETMDVVPEVKGNVSLTITVGNNNSEVVVKGTPEVTPTPVPQPHTPDPTPTSKTYNLEKPYTEIKSIDVIYGGFTITVSPEIMNTLKNFLSNEATSLEKWKNTENKIKTYSGQEVQVTGTKGSLTKTVTFINGLVLKGRSYTVTVNNDNSVTVTNSKNVSYTISKGADNKSLTITPIPVGLDFKATF